MAACPRMSSGAVGSSMNLSRAYRLGQYEMHAVDAPWLDLLQAAHIVDGLLDVPNLVGINHQHSSSGAGILPSQLLTVEVSGHRSGRKVLGVINDRTDDFSAAEIVGLVCANLHLEVVEAGRNSLFREPSNLFVGVPWRR
jgi:hypothetical protein